MRFQYGSSPQQILDHYFPLAAVHPSRAHLVLVHGGGWTTGDPASVSMPFYAQQAQALGFDATSVGYRLAGPGVSWVEQAADIEAGVAWIRATIGNLAALPLLILGESAGGHLGAVVAYRGVLSPVGFVAMYGAHDFIDLDTDVPGHPWSANPAALRACLGGTVPWETPGPAIAASSITFAAACALPPRTLLVHSTDDPLIGPNQSRRLMAALDGKTDVTYTEFPGAHHGDLACITPPISDAIIAFLSAVIARPSHHS